MTGSPASISDFAVPPVEMSLTPIASRPRAKSTRPVLSGDRQSAWAMGAVIGKAS